MDKIHNVSRMLRADPNRIAWFLELQRIRGFARHFMAPSTRFRAKRPQIPEQLNSTSSAIPLFGNINGFSERSDPTQIAALSHLQREALAGKRFTSTKVNHVVTPQASQLPAVNLPKRRIEISRSNATIDPAFREAIQKQMAITQVSYSSKGSAQGSKFQEDGQAKTRLLVSVAPIAVDFGERQSEFAELALARKRTVSSTSDSTSELQLATQSGPSSLDTAGTVDNRSPSPGSNGPAYNQSRRSSPGVSTLHIDGSALGRWAVQHLERTLGKPAAGMTGVDPRAAIPRSRVSPF